VNIEKYTAHIIELAISTTTTKKVGRRERMDIS
jgi:hypothetical protein